MDVLVSPIGALVLQWPVPPILDSHPHASHWAPSWVARGFNQLPRVEYDENFSHVVKPTTIRTVLTIVVSKQWPIHQLDVTNAFLHEPLSEPVLCEHISGFIDPAHPDHVCYLRKALYGLKLVLDFVRSKSDTSLFVYSRGSVAVYVLLYVDDIILTTSSSAALADINY